MGYYNSIQDGACCRSCFIKLVEQAKQDGTIIALSEEFRFGAAQVISRVVDHLEGIEDPFPIDKGYVDRVILRVTDQEIIIIRNDADPAACFGWGRSNEHE